MRAVLIVPGDPITDTFLGPQTPAPLVFPVADRSLSAAPGSSRASMAAEVEEAARWSNASYLLGWWHYVRLVHLPVERADPGELARAVVRFAQFRFPPDSLPKDILA